MGVGGGGGIHSRLIRTVGRLYYAVARRASSSLWWVGSVCFGPRFVRMSLMMVCVLDVENVLVLCVRALFRAAVISFGVGVLGRPFEKKAARDIDQYHTWLVPPHITHTLSGPV